MKPILVIILMSCLVTSASIADPTFHIYQMNADTDVSALEQKGVEIHPYGVAEKREFLFEKVALTPSLENFDALDRDVLMMRARSLKFERLKEHYPNLDSTKLKKLQDSLHEK